MRDKLIHDYFGVDTEGDRIVIHQRFRFFGIGVPQMGDVGMLQASSHSISHRKL